MTRILTSLVGLPILFVIIKYLPPGVFLTLVAAAVVFTVWFVLRRMKGGTS